MAHLILHIGMQKTGSTSIQATLHKSRRRLIAQGFDYLPVGVNHSHLFQTLYNSKPEGLWHNLVRGHDTPEKIEGVRADLRARMIRAFRRSRGPAMIVSGEILSAMREKPVAEIAEFLRAHFEKITVIGYVRPPAAFITSLSQQMIRVGRVDHETLRDLPAPEYRAKFGKFFSLFGRENVRLVPYRPADFPHQCVVADFLALIGAPPAFYDTLRVVRTNESLSLAAARVLLMANKLFPRTVEGRFNHDRPPGLLPLVSQLGGPKFRLARRCLQPVLDAAREDIAWMEDVLGARFEEELSDDPALACDFDVPWQFSREEMEAMAALFRQWSRSARPARVKRQRS